MAGKWLQQSEAVGDILSQYIGPCSRCPMVNVEQRTGKVNKQVLLGLAKYRRARSQINFGQFLTISSGHTGLVTVGSEIKVQTSGYF